jgi:hypothetical protein
MKFADSVMLSRIDDELVLLDKERGVYYGLDAIGYRMVTLLIEHNDFDAVADLLCQEYDAPKDRISRDLRQLTDTLVARGLLHDQA